VAVVLFNRADEPLLCVLEVGGGSWVAELPAKGLMTALTEPARAS
jgi:hypothetical protein